jgi:hypothetical protein
MNRLDNKTSISQMNIYYFVSGHGFGHISRTSVILEKLVKRKEIHQIHLISSRVSFLDLENEKLIKREQSLDVGVFQKDSLSLDINKTKEALEDFEKNKNSILKKEADYCRKNQIGLIITDVASLPISLAVEVGIPSIFIGNFTWDFIYENYGKDDPYFYSISQLIRTEYSFATEALFLPFTCPMPTFLESANVGLVGRKPKLSKPESRRQFGFSEDTTYILLTFGAYGLSGFRMNWENLPAKTKLVAYGVPGLDMDHVLAPSECHYPDLVCACDYILTKPGYGILAEAYYAKTPILYTDRGDFSEYPVLVSALSSYLESAYISHQEISDCNFQSAISRLDSQKKKQNLLDIEPDGEDTIISHILEYT